MPEQWRQPVSSNRLTTPALADGLLVYQGGSGDEAQDVSARDAATGDLRWTADLDRMTNSLSPLAIDSGLVFVAQAHKIGDDVFANDYASELLALDLQTGETQWSVAQDAPGDTFHSRILPAAAGGVVYFETSGGDFLQRLSAADAVTGDPLWDYPLLLTYTLSVRPVVVGDLLLSAQTDYTFDQEQTQVFALDAATGAPRWQVDMPGRLLQSAFAVGEGRLFILTGGGRATALDAATGDELWVVPLPINEPYGERSDPAYADGQVFFSPGDPQGTVVALDAATGAENWTYSDGQYLAADLAASDGHVFLGTTYGRFVALAAATGAVEWFALNNSHPSTIGQDTIPRMDTAPLVEGGMIYLVLQEALVALEVGP